MKALPFSNPQYDYNPQGKLWMKDEKKFGFQLLSKMGWSKGKGLGKNEDGMVENLKVRKRKDKFGVGCDDKVDLGLQSSAYDAVLQNLNKNFQSSSVDKTNSTSEKSLENRSQEFKSRINYQKFLKGKDVSRYSEKDMDSIFVKTKVEKNGCSKESLDCNETTSEKSTLNPTYSSQMNMKEYFDKKWKQKLGELNGDQPEDLDTPNSSRKRKRKSSGDGNLSQALKFMSTPENINGESSRKEKRKSKTLENNESFKNRDISELFLYDTSNKSNDTTRLKNKSKLKVNTEDVNDADKALGDEHCIDNSVVVLDKVTEPKKKRKSHAETLPDEAPLYIALSPEADSSNSKETKKLKKKSKVKAHTENINEAGEIEVVESNTDTNAVMADEDAEPRKKRKKGHTETLPDEAPSYIAFSPEADSSNSKETKKLRKKSKLKANTENIDEAGEIEVIEPNTDTNAVMADEDAEPRKKRKRSHAETLPDETASDVALCLEANSSNSKETTKLKKKSKKKAKAYDIDGADELSTDDNAEIVVDTEKEPRKKQKRHAETLPDEDSSDVAISLESESSNSKETSKKKKSKKLKDALKSCLKTAVDMFRSQGKRNVSFNLNVSLKTIENCLVPEVEIKESDDNVAVEEVKISEKEDSTTNIVNSDQTEVVCVSSSDEEADEQSVESKLKDLIYQSGNFNSVVDSVDNNMKINMQTNSKRTASLLQRLRSRFDVLNKLTPDPIADNLTPDPITDKTTPDSLAGKKTRDSVTGRKTRDSLAGRKTRDLKAGRKTRDSLAGRKTRDSMAGRKTRDSMAGRKTRDSLAGRKTRDPLAGGETLYPMAGLAGPYSMAGLQAPYSMAGRETPYSVAPSWGALHLGVARSETPNSVAGRETPNSVADKSTNLVADRNTPDFNVSDCNNTFSGEVLRQTQLELDSMKSDFNNASSATQRLMKFSKLDCAALPECTGENAKYHFDIQVKAAKTKRMTHMLEMWQRHPILKTTNLIDIKGYGNWE